MKIIGSLVVVFVSIFLSACWSGYVLSILWGWFMVTTFALPPLTIPAAIGMSLIVGYLTHQIKDEDVDNDKDFKETMIRAIIIATIKPAFALLVGWIITLFM